MLPSGQLVFVARGFGWEGPRVSSAGCVCCAMATVPIFPGAAQQRSAWVKVGMGHSCSRPVPEMPECFGANEQPFSELGE